MLFLESINSCIDAEIQEGHVCTLNFKFVIRTFEKPLIGEKLVKKPYDIS